MHAFILKNILPKLEMVMQELVSPKTEKQKDLLLGIILKDTNNRMLYVQKNV
jgi:hypothetical protein